MGMQGNAAWQKMRQNWDKSVPAGAAAAAGGAMFAAAPAAGQHLYGGRMTDSRHHQAVKVTQVIIGQVTLWYRAHGW